MKLDRVADIPIRHRFVDYICTVGYSEDEQEFNFVAARYAHRIKRSVPKIGYSLYMRILKEPVLRAALIEALLPNEKLEILELREKALNQRANNYGFVVGIATFCVVPYAIYVLTSVLAKAVGYSAAEAISYVLAFFGFLVVFPVQRYINRWYKRRYCTQHGHRFGRIRTNGGNETTWCKRCGLRPGDNSLNEASTNGGPFP